MTPCRSAATNYAKSHDFGLKHDLGLRIRSDYLYLVQYRNPVRSLASNYHVHVNNHPKQTEQVHWERYALEQIELWNQFVDKWLILNRRWQTTLTCPYEQLIGHPAETVTRIIRFMSTAPVSLPARDRALERVNLRPKRNLEKFDYYDERFFDELERLASPRIAVLNLPTYKLGI